MLFYRLVKSGVFFVEIEFGKIIFQFLKGHRMPVVTEKPKTMKVAEVKAKAKELGIVVGKMKKTELIHAIQTAENNTPCYGTCKGWCDQSECCFIADCVKV